MPSSIPTHKFLLDENVRIELFKFLKNKGLNVKLAPKGASDEQLLSISKREKRILVTNDQDFVESAKEEVFSVVWLRIPQSSPEKLISSFENLVENLKDFSEMLIILRTNRWDELPLSLEVKIMQ